MSRPCFDAADFADYDLDILVDELADVAAELTDMDAAEDDRAVGERLPGVTSKAALRRWDRRRRYLEDYVTVASPVLYGRTDGTMLGTFLPLD